MTTVVGVIPGQALIRIGISGFGTGTEKAPRSSGRASSGAKTLTPPRAIRIDGGFLRLEEGRQLSRAMVGA